MIIEKVKTIFRLYKLVFDGGDSKLFNRTTNNSVLSQKKTDSCI